MIERVEHRVLGAVRFVDAASRAPIRNPLQLRSAHARFARNARNLSVVTAATGFDDYTACFAPPLPAVAARDVVAFVRDPAGQYLPRSFTLHLPRPPEGGTALPADSVFRTVDVLLLPGAGARLAAGFAEARIRVTNAATGAGQPNVLVRALLPAAAPAPARLLGVGMSDPRGEALVAMPQAPFYRPGATAAAVVTEVIPLRFEFVPMPHRDDAGELPIVDWSEHAERPASAQNSTEQQLTPSRKLAFEFAVTIAP